MHQASVGFHCPECVKESGQKVVTPRSLQNANPVVTYALIGANVIMWFALLASGATPSGLGTSELALDLAVWGPPIDIADEWYRIVTGGFLHANLIHVGFNMLLLYMLGRQLERVLGWVDFSILYLGGLLGGSFGALLLDPAVLTVGASGAVFGLMGGWIMYTRSRGISFMESGVAGLVLLNLLLTFSVGGISRGGHVGGLAGGLLVGWLLVQGRERLPSRGAVIGAAAGLCLAFAVGAVWAASTWTDPLL